MPCGQHGVVGAERAQGTFTEQRERTPPTRIGAQRETKLRPEPGRVQYVMQAWAARVPGASPEDPRRDAAPRQFGVPVDISLTGFVVGQPARDTVEAVPRQIERAKPARWVHSEDAVAVVRQNRRHAGQRLVGEVGVRGVSSRVRDGAGRPLDRVHDPMVTVRRLPRNRDGAKMAWVVTMAETPFMWQAVNRTEPHGATNSMMI